MHAVTDNAVTHVIGSGGQRTLATVLHTQNGVTDNCRGTSTSNGRRIPLICHQSA